MAGAPNICARHLVDVVLGVEWYKQISEAQLLAYLLDGWQVVPKLENGEEIVKR